MPITAIYRRFRAHFFIIFSYFTAVNKSPQSRKMTLICKKKKYKRTKKKLYNGVASEWKHRSDEVSANRWAIIRAIKRQYEATPATPATLPGDVVRINGASKLMADKWRFAWLINRCCWSCWSSSSVRCSFWNSLGHHRCFMLGLFIIEWVVIYVLFIGFDDDGAITRPLST